MTLSCDRCGAAFEKENVNLEYGIATCGYCHAVSRLTRESPKSDAPQRAGVGKAPVPRPAGILIEKEGRTLRITRRWFQPMFLGLLFFCIAWDSFLVFWYAMAGSAPGPFSLFAMVFPVAHVAVGVGLTYITLAGLLNRTRIEASGGELTIRHGPIPWRGSSTPVDDLDQLYCEEQVNRGSKGGSSTSYRLNALLKDGRKLKLISSLPEPDQAVYLEQQIEEHLDIEDREVGTEYRR